MKQSLPSKITSAIALGIGLSPVIQSGMAYLPSGDFNSFSQNIAAKYSAGITENGQFSVSRAAEAYGPLLAAILFKKATGYLLKHARLKF